MNAFIQLGFTVGGYYSAYPACQMAELNFNGIAGLTLPIVGELKKELFTDYRRPLENGDCPPPM